MPLLKYFTIVGAALTIVLLVINAVIEPAKPPLRPAAATRVVTVPEPRTTTGSTADTRPLPLPAVGQTGASSDAPAVEAVNAQSPQLHPVPVQPPAAAARTRSKKRASAGRAKADVPARAAYAPPPVESYARERAARDYGAEGTLGPH
jgi:hypothetical protein